MYISPENVRKTSIKGKQSNSTFKIVTWNRYLLLKTSKGSSETAASDSNVIFSFQQDDKENQVKKIPAPPPIFVQGVTN